MPLNKCRIRVQRTISASRQAVFAALTEPAHLNKWFTSRARVDLRAGGRYANADHDTGTFLRIVPGRNLAFTWDNPAACPGTTVSINIYRLALRKCRVVLAHSGLPAQERGMDGLYGGWSWALSSLKSYLETGQPVKHDEWMAEHK